MGAVTDNELSAGKEYDLCPIRIIRTSTSHRPAHSIGGSVYEIIDVKQPY